MSKNIEHVQHLKSKMVVDGSPKLPNPSALTEGEIAVNYAKGYETLSIKNESGDVVSFSSDEYYTEKKLGSAFTGANSAVTVTDVLASINEVEVNSGDTPIGSGIEIWVDESVDPEMADVYTKAETDDLLAEKLDASAYTENNLWVSGTGENSVVLNNSSGIASGNFSVAEGSKASATSNASHAEGYGTIASGDYGSHAEGNSTRAIGPVGSHAEGQNTTASGASSHAEGAGTFSIGSYSHAEGSSTRAIGEYSHAEGSSTQASGSSSHAEGYTTTANGEYSHAEGYGTIASGDYGSHAEGYYTSAMTNYSHAEGNSTKASGSSSHAEGTSTQASGSCSHAEGNNTQANGNYSHAEGYYTTASGMSSHAEGQGTKANGSYSHAEGQSTQANGNYSHAEGSSTYANGPQSHAEGGMTVANDWAAHAEGQNTLALGQRSHAEGGNTRAQGSSSHAEGYNTFTINDSEHASGYYNISVSATTELGDSGNTLFSIGNGTSDNARHNAFEVRQNGDIYIVNKDGNDVKLQDEIGNITVDQTIDSGTSASTNPVSSKAVYGFVTSYTPSITVDQVLDNTTSASTNPVSSKAVYSAITDNELVWTNAYVALSGAVSSHTSNNEIHITSAEKTNLDSLATNIATISGITTTKVNNWDEAYASAHTHTNMSNLNSITGNVGTAAYKGVSNGITNSDNLIEAKHIYSGVGVTIAYDNSTHYIQLKSTSGNILSEFDASAFIVDGMVDDVRIEDVAGSGTCLVVDFNTASGKQDINIPISEIFNANNYYTKSETSGATELTTALGAKVDSATYTGHTADTNVHFSGSEKENLDSLATNIAAISGITSTKVSNWDGAATNSHTHSNKTALDGITGTVGTMAYQNTSSYSSATEVNTALAGKSDTGHTHSISDVTNLQTTLNGKANTATTLSGYGITNAYTKTEIDNKIGDIESILATI